MTEPRMRLRQKGQQFPTQDLEAFLLAFGDNDYPLPETVRILDEIVTDYIIETCHEAASVAHHARRAKIKLDDFKFMLRRDTGKLGRVSEMLETDKELKRKRKAFDTDEGAVMAEKGQPGEGGAVETVEKEGKKMGRPPGKKTEEEEGGRKKKKRKEKGREEPDDASTHMDGAKPYAHDSLSPVSRRSSASGSGSGSSSDLSLTAVINKAVADGAFAAE